MTAAELKAWRESFGWLPSDAGRQLGITGRMVRYYESGHAIPRYIELATWALAHGPKYLRL